MRHHLLQPFCLDPPSYRSRILSSLQSLYFRPSRLPGSLFSESGKGMGTAFLRFHIISRKMPYQAMYKLYHKSYNLPVEAMCSPSRSSYSQAISLSKATVFSRSLPERLRPCSLFNDTVMKYSSCAPKQNLPHLSSSPSPHYPRRVARGLSISSLKRLTIFCSLPVPNCQSCHI